MPRPALLRPLIAATAGVLLVAMTGAPATARPGPSQACGHHDPAACRWAERTMRAMSTGDKVGQLFVTYAYGSSVDTEAPADVAANRAAYGVDNAEQLIDTYHLGGIIYFTWANNVADPAQTAALSNGVQRAAAATGARVPMLIGTDQEQGAVTRIGPPATQFPGNMALGAAGAPADTRTAAAITGAELMAMGINQDYAPDADVNVNPANPVIGVRSFSSEPALAARLTAAAVTGYRASGVIPTAKHFPGHGDTAVDSHTGLLVITHTRQEWERLDRPPFAAAIAAGVDSIMSAHLVVPALDPSGDPATLSAPILTGVLRGELGFDGVVITDSLAMAGVRQRYGDDRVPVLAVNAGADQLLMPPDLDLAVGSVRAAVASGEITMARLDASVFRILRMKYERGLVGRPPADPDRLPALVGTAAHLAAARRITDRTVTLLRNDGGLLPLAPSSVRQVLVTGWGETTTRTLAGAVAARGPATAALPTGAAPSAAQIDAAVAAAGGADLVLVTTRSASTGPQQRQLVAALHATGVPVAVVAVGTPYDVAWLPDPPVSLATYNHGAGSLESAARVLFGEVAPTGRLPVTVPVAGTADQVLYPFGYGLGFPAGTG